MSHILKVGFEIEGGWKGERGISPFKDISLIKDGSINGQTLRTSAIQATHVGEAVSEPMDIDRMDYTGVAGESPLAPQWEIWLRSHWPDADPPNRTNNTCGYHIHISVRSAKDYALLSLKSFSLELKERMMALGKQVNLPPKHYFWSRIEGKNSFCTFFYDPASQMKVTNKDEINRVRYGWLNLAHGLHGTVEFRALPTFRDSKIAVIFTREYFSFVEEWLTRFEKETIEKEAKF